MRRAATELLPTCPTKATDAGRGFSAQRLRALSRVKVRDVACLPRARTWVLPVLVFSPSSHALAFRFEVGIAIGVGLPATGSILQNFGGWGARLASVFAMASPFLTRA